MGTVGGQPFSGLSRDVRLGSSVGYMLYVFFVESQSQESLQQGLCVCVCVCVCVFETESGQSAIKPK